MATLNAAEVVPGDVIRVRLGDFVPADFKILDAEVTVDQSAITGESLPIDKKTDDVVYSGRWLERVRLQVLLLPRVFTRILARRYSLFSWPSLSCIWKRLFPAS